MSLKLHKIERSKYYHELRNCYDESNTLLALISKIQGHEKKFKAMNLIFRNLHDFSQIKNVSDIDIDDSNFESMYNYEGRIISNIIVPKTKQVDDMVTIMSIIIKECNVFNSAKKKRKGNDNDECKL